MKKINLWVVYLLTTALLSCDFSSKFELASSTTKPVEVGTSSNQMTSLFPDPGLKNPKIHFHTGGVANNQPEISPNLPNIPGSEASPWFFTQWRRPTPVSPLIMSLDPEVDPELGKATYYFPTSDNLTYFKIYTTSDKKYVYELYAKGGMLDFAGGTNVFLSANAIEPQTTFEKKVDYSVDLKFNKARIGYSTPTAKNSGAVMSQLFTGFVLSYKDPAQPEQIPTTLFMQIYHNNTSFPGSTYRGCYRNGGAMQLVYGNALSGDSVLNFDTTLKKPARLRFSINQYLCDMISKGFDCDDNGKKFRFEFPEVAKNLKNWKMGSMYVGLEVQDTDKRPGAASDKAQGSVEAAVQISNLSVLRDENSSFNFARDCQ